MTDKPEVPPSSPRDGLIREVLQAEHEIRTIALVEWGWPSGPRHDALRRWAVALCEAAAALQALGRERDGRVPSAWSECGDGHDYSRTGKHDPNDCRFCLRHVLKKVEASELAARAVKAEATLAAVSQLAKEATNGWACYAKSKREHEEIARLHRDLAKVLTP
jgi:hypothetical protein